MKITTPLAVWGPAYAFLYYTEPDIEPTRSQYFMLAYIIISEQLIISSTQLIASWYLDMEYFVDKGSHENVKQWNCEIGNATNITWM